jgi:hypothetical protein
MRYPMLGRGASPLEVHDGRLVILSDNIIRQQQKAGAFEPLEADERLKCP